MRKYLLILLHSAVIFSATLVAFNANAQQTSIYTHAEKEYRVALDLYDKEKYGAAQAEFEKLLAKKEGVSNEVRTNAEYYAALCGIALFNNGTEKRLEDFVNTYPENSRKQLAAYHLGRFYYKQKNYRNAANWLEKVDVYFLSQNEVAEYYFKLGYAYFSVSEFDKAGKAFYEILNTENKYKEAANYYYSHIQYQQKHYETALKGFLKLKDSEAFGSVSVYYVAQIYYLQGKYEDLLNFAVPIMDKLTAQNALEIARMVGDAYYRSQKYAEAIPYLEQYVKGAPIVKPAEQYQLGFSLYKTKSYDGALLVLQKISGTEDSLAQTSLCIIADSYINLNDKKKARNTFWVASKINADKQIKESSFFNYAKISYELGFQSEAINAFQIYTKTYPNSPKLDEANSYLATLFYYTKNYEAAMEALDNIKSQNENTKRSYQRAAYYRGVELYSNIQMKSAIQAFDKSLLYSVDAKLAAMALYWKGDCHYRLSDYTNAIKLYESFLYTPAAVDLREFVTTYYNIGYCYYRKDEYSNALTWFRKFLKEKEQADNLRYDDAILRVADCYFVQKDYPNALDNYTLALNEGSVASDYALFQKATILGIQGKLDAKIGALQSMLVNYQKSAYYDDAMYEMATASILKGDALQALNLYNEIVEKYPQSSYVKKALLGLGLLYYNEKRDEKALEIYKQVVTNYPGTAEAKEALNGIKNVYVNSGNADGYLKYAATVSFASVSESTQDSVMYEAAEQRYMGEDCEKATVKFNEYLQRFPKGSFTVNASFYKAECEYRAKQYEQALMGYTYVIEKPKNTFTEKSLLKAATISYQQKQYDKAFTYYKSLEEHAELKNNITEAQTGIMRSAFTLGKYKECIEYADKMLDNEKLSEGLTKEAHLLSGKSLFNMDSLDAARAHFEQITKVLNNNISSEAKYYIAFIEFKKQQYKQVEKTIFYIANQSSSDYWVAKAYILLADNYVAQKDVFQAKATLKSVIDNAEGEDILKEAKQKLDAIVAEEKAKQEKEQKERELKLKPAVSDSLQQEVPQNQY